MMGRNHAVIGGAAALTLVITQAVATRTAIQPTGWDGMAVLVGTAAALLPDLDSTDTAARTQLGMGREQIRREWRRRPSLALIGRWLVSLPLNLFAWLMPHRGPTHWLVTAVAVTVALYSLTSLLTIPDIVPLAFGVGYLSHLLADGLTVAGLPLFGPLIRRPVHLLPWPLRFRTGGVVESLALLVILVGLFVWTMTQIMA